MSVNKTGKYLKYALGEIILVVLGILIALSINNWNEERKNEVKEKDALIGIKNALESDLELYENVYQPRFDFKEKGLEFLKKAQYEQLILSNDTLLKYLGRMGTDIIFRNDSGPYDGLKSAGFNLIKNKNLRKDIINTYEVTLPAFERFINDYTKDYIQLEQKYREELLSTVVIKKDDDSFDTDRKINVDYLLNHPSFLELLRIEENKYYNYVNRMGYIKRKMKELKSKIEHELDD